jgi:uncharacterized membrane protein
LALLSLAFVMSPAALARLQAPRAGIDKPVEFAEAAQIVMTRCTPCHARQPTFQGFVGAPKGIVFETAEAIDAQRADIRRVAVDSQIMPLGNLTGMTADERQTLTRWVTSIQK